MFQSRSTIRVLAADRTPIDTQLLADALSKNPEIEVCGVFSSAQAALAAMHRTNPDVFLLSSTLEDAEMKGFEVARLATSNGSKARIVMLLDCSEPTKVVEAFRCGARGVFCRNESLESLLKCIQSVHIGQVWANTRELTFLLDAFNQMPNWQTALGSSAKLSKREKEVVLAVAEGLTNRQIAKQLGLTEHTVKNYLFRIYDKLGVSTRVELVIYGLSCHQRKPAPSLVPVKTGPQLAFVRSRESAV